MIHNLAYIGFASPAADEWRSFGPDVLAAELAPDGPDGAIRLRVDDAAWRIAIRSADTNDLDYLGWDVGNAAGLDELVEKVTASGRDPIADDALAELRQVAAAAWFVDPFGFRHELTYGLATGQGFQPSRPMSGFVTGDQGVGHVVLIVPDLEAGERFYTDVLGLKASDSIGDYLRFLHCPGASARHHTLALAGIPGMVGMHHLMLEVGSIDDVGTALDIVNERQIPLAAGLGRHTNDLMTSFYVRTPSGFEIEYGTGGILIDDATWTVGAHTATSVWGHKEPASGPLIPQIIRPVEPATQPA
jgi:3,4-dihydroxy-9,10-secoandrosta-1,3,5(10)-triene-9,17-dione 4,5-dioxygenase